MAEYSKKTCNSCGLRDIQPNMYRVEKEVQVGRSDNRVTAGNLAFALAGSNQAAKKVKRSIVANNRRVYTRKREVWMCGNCSGVNAARAEADAKEQIRAEKKLRQSQGSMGFMGWAISLLGVWIFGTGVYTGAIAILEESGKMNENLMVLGFASIGALFFARKIVRAIGYTKRRVFG